MHRYWSVFSLLFCLALVTPASLAFAQDEEDGEEDGGPSCAEMLEATATDLATCADGRATCEALATSPYLDCVYDEDRRRVEWNPTGGGEDGADGTGACECRPGTKPDPTMEDGDRLRCVSALSAEQRCAWYGLVWDTDAEKCVNLRQYAETTDARLVCLEDADERHVAWNATGGAEPDSEEPGPGACECGVGYVPDPDLPEEAELSCVLDPDIDEATCGLVDGYKWFRDECMERWAAQTMIDLAQDVDTRAAKKRADDAHALGTSAKAKAVQVASDLALYGDRDIKVRLGFNMRLRVGPGIDEVGSDHGFTSSVNMPAGNAFPTLYFGILVPTGAEGGGALEIGGYAGGHTGFIGGGNLLYLHYVTNRLRLGGGIDLGVVMSHAFGGNFPSWEVRCWMPHVVGVLRYDIGQGFELKVELGGGPDVIEFYDDRQNTASFTGVAGIEVALP